MGDVGLSIVVPVFNRHESLQSAVASIAGQPGRIPIIIVDDGSAPEFAAVADEIASTADAPVRVVHQPNRGPAAARNTGLDLVDSRFVMFLDSDDHLARTAFQTIDRHLVGTDDVGMLSGAVRVVSADGTAKTVHPIVPNGVSWAKLSLLAGSFVVRTDVARAVGGYDETLHYGENTDFILRLAEQCQKSSLRVVATNDELSVYHAAADERRYDPHRLNAAIHLLRRGRFDLQLRSERARLHAVAAVNAARLGHYLLAVKHAALAVRAQPTNPHHLVRLAASFSGPLARRRWLRL